MYRGFCFSLSHLASVKNEFQTNEYLSHKIKLSMKLFKVLSSLLFYASVCKADVGLSATDENITGGLRGMDTTETSIISDSDSDSLPPGMCNQNTPCRDETKCCSRFNICATGEKWCSPEWGCKNNCITDAPSASPTLTPTLTPGRCNDETPCADGSCCNKVNRCGTSWMFCSKMAGCKSNCWNDE